MGKREVGKAEFGGDLAEALFVDGMAVGVQQADGEGFNAAGAEGNERSAGGGFIEGLENRAVGGEAFRNLDDGFVEFRRLRNVEVEEVRAVLVADAQAIGKTGGGDEGGACTAPFQEGVGGARGAEADLEIAKRRGERKAKKPTDARHGCFLGGGEFSPGARRRCQGKRSIEREGTHRMIKGGDEANRLSQIGYGAVETVADKVARGCSAKCGIAPLADGRTDDVRRRIAAGAEQLVGADCTGRRTGDAVGEGSTHIDPETPWIRLS